MAFEGLNNAGIERSNLLVILNDNNMAIDPNHGALNDYLLDITTSKTWNRVKDDTWKILGFLSKIGPDARRMVQTLENAIKHMILKQSNLFESLHFRYFGPVDGHDVLHLVKILQDMKGIEGPKLLHILTKKGKGVPLAEENQTAYHAPGKFDKVTGQLLDEEPTGFPPKYQEVFGHTLLELARANPLIMGITPAMLAGSSMNLMKDEMPDRTFDVGIAEQHAVTFSAGLATQGFIPFCNIYSSFMQRAFDQVIHDIALQKLPVVFCLDRGGLVGSDGPTHHGSFDIAFMRIIPNMIVAAPMNEEELRNMMYTAQEANHGPFVIRYPRGQGVMTDWRRPFASIPVGKGRMIADGETVAVLSVGHPGNHVVKAFKILEKEGIRPAHFDMRFIKPLDAELLHVIFARFNRIITVEDGTVAGGFGSAVSEFMANNRYTPELRMLGIPDEFVEHGTQRQLYRECGFDPEGIAAAIRGMA
jgi:1-deoxy-D-xylulose-5-phosphate synthase